MSRSNLHCGLHWPLRHLGLAAVLAGAWFLALSVLAGAETLPAPQDRCPITGRFPVRIVADDYSDLLSLIQSRIDIDGVSGLTVRAYVDDEEFQWLKECGYRVTPIPNEARRAYLEMMSRPGREDYHTYESLTAELQQIAQDYPDIAQLFSIGQSVEGRELWVMKISDNVQIDEPEPEFKFSSTMHGDEPVGMELCVYLIRLLVQNYGVDPEITDLVNDLEIWICPLHNPDGYVHGTRYNADGYDLNRSFPDPVTDPNDDPTGRPPEVQHMMYFQYDHNFLLGANYHTGALVVNYPWDCMADYTPDDTMIRNLSLGYSYRNPPMWNNPEFEHGVTIGWQWYIIHGGMQDWAYNWRNEVHVTIEVSNNKWPPSSQLPQLWDDNREAMLWYMGQARIGVEGFVTDAIDGSPIKATVDVLEIGKPVWGEPTYGYYHRLLEPGTYTLEFSAFGYETQTVPGVTVEEGDATELNVQMERVAGFTVSGTVVDQESGAPLAAEVAAYRHDTGEFFRNVSADPVTGHYEMEVPAWEYDFVASADQYVPVTETRNVTGPLTLDFQLLRARGEVLLVEDNNPGTPMAEALAEIGYLVTEEAATATDPDTWGDYDLVIWSAGSYKNPVQSEWMRDALEDFVAAGNHLLVEGGEIGYDATHTPGYPSFAGNVLHVSQFHADDAGQLELRPGQEDHPLVTTPNSLPSTLGIDYDYFADEDAVTPTDEATLIYGTHDYPTDAGLLVYDGPSTGEGQIVYFAFDYAALSSQSDARDLLENALEYLGAAGAQATEEDMGVVLALRLGQPHPSPCHGRAAFSVLVPDGAEAKISIYDSQGRSVTTLARGLDAGFHFVQWDGTDLHGTPVSSGVYYVRVSATDGSSAARRLVLAR